MTTPSHPHSLEAEALVLGAALVHTPTLAAVMPLVSPEEFYHPAHQAIFEAMAGLVNASKPVDAVAVLEAMRDRDTAKTLAHLDGGDYLTKLMDGVVTVENVAYHAGIVRSKARRRKCAHVLRELAAAGFGDASDEEYRERVAAGVLDILTEQADPRAMSLRKVIREVLTTVEKRYDNRSSVTGIPTGYPDLDDMLSGLQPGELIIVAGRPSMGKSALAFNLVVQSAQQAKTAALVFSVEMSRTSVAERMLSADGPVEGMRLRSGRLGQADWLHLTNAASRLVDLAIVLDDSGAVSIADIRARSRAWAVGEAKAATNRLVVVDYLQLVAGERVKNGNREQEVASISRGLKQLAKELRCPVVALSQLSRSLESRSDKRPTLSDLRESGALEQDADVIAFVYRDEVYHEDSKDRGVAEIIVAKQRNGPTGTVKLSWHRQFSRFGARGAE
jgi:replicative DNA helicase